MGFFCIQAHILNIFKGKEYFLFIFFKNKVEGQSVWSEMHWSQIQHSQCGYSPLVSWNHESKTESSSRFPCIQTTWKRNTVFIASDFIR